MRKGVPFSTPFPPLTFTLFTSSTSSPLSGGLRPNVHPLHRRNDHRHRSAHYANPRYNRRESHRNLHLPKTAAAR